MARLLNEMLGAGVINTYAVFGAVAQMRYTEAVATLDADVLVGVPAPAGLDVLRPIYQFCAARGYQPEGEAIRVGAWPVQFIVAFSPLTEEAMQHAQVEEVGGVPLRVVGPDYLAAIALSVGRAKDHARVLALFEAGATTVGAVAALAARHGLAAKWAAFQGRFLDG